MSPKTLIVANPDFTRSVDSPESLYVSEFFYDTIQGENNVGWPAAFLRLQRCTLNCTWCDTTEVWRYGNPYTIDELLDMINGDLFRKLRYGQHLVLTGGSPLRQQHILLIFIQKFMQRFHFKPYIEIENECTIQPLGQLIPYIDCWNNSPKLSNSGNPIEKRYQPRIIEFLSELENSWFKFVINNEQDWNEIAKTFYIPGLIKRNQIVLMPCGATREELEKNREMVVELAIKHNVRYTTREHIILWDKKTGV